MVHIEDRLLGSSRWRPSAYRELPTHLVEYLLHPNLRLTPTTFSSKLTAETANVLCIVTSAVQVGDSHGWREQQALYVS
jgi:hypothetical protein